MDNRYIHVIIGRLRYIIICIPAERVNSVPTEMLILLTETHPPKSVPHYT